MYHTISTLIGERNGRKVFIAALQWKHEVSNQFNLMCEKIIKKGYLQPLSFNFIDNQTNYCKVRYTQNLFILNKYIKNQLI